MEEIKKTKTTKKPQTKSLQSIKTNKTVTNKPKVSTSVKLLMGKKIIKNKTPELKKYKTSKKPKRKKWKIIVSSIAFSLIGVFVVGFCFLFSWNDFALTTVLSNNAGRSFYIVEKVMDNAFNSRYFDMEINFDYRPVGATEPTTKTQTFMKVIHFDDDKYGYVGVCKYTEETSFNLYYKEGVLYQNVVGHETESKSKQSIATAQATLQTMMIIGYINGSYVFPTENGVLANKDNFQLLKTSFLINSSPFYIGETFEFTYGVEKEIYKLDLNGNLKERTYTQTYSGYDFTLNIKYTSINQLLELDYPSDLNTY